MGIKIAVEPHYFAKAFELVIANSCFLKKENHLVIFCKVVDITQIDYLRLSKGVGGLCMDDKVISSERLTIQHTFLIMNLEIK